MNYLQELNSMCHLFSIEVNEHRLYYESVEEYFKDLPNKEDLKYIEKSVYEQMINQDTIIKVDIYPEHPVTFYTVYHYDIESALKEAYLILIK